MTRLAKDIVVSSEFHEGPSFCETTEEPMRFGAKAFEQELTMSFAKLTCSTFP